MSTKIEWTNTSIKQMREPKLHFIQNGAAVCRQNAVADKSQLKFSEEKGLVTCRMCLDILDGKINLARFRSMSDLPSEAVCLQCDQIKPIDEMMVAYLKTDKLFRVRPRCKSCHNENEKGNRLDYKRKYLQDWRKRNVAVNKSYRADKEYYRNQARKFYQRNREVMLIQVRLRYRGLYHTLDECREMLEKYGKNYPLASGLSKDGGRECERIRARLRKKQFGFGGRMLKSWEIRMMVYEDAEENISFLQKT